jgi:hypothetical protein
MKSGLISFCKLLNYRDFIFLAILIAATLLMLASLTPFHNWGDDFAAYILQSQSLISGSIEKLITQNKFTMQNSYFHFGPYAAPWGFPILLAPVVFLFGVNIPLIKLVGIVCYLLFLITIYLQYARPEKSLIFLLYIACFVFNPTMLDGLSNILSDIPFLFFSTLSLSLILKPYSNNYVPKTIWYGIVVGALIAFSYQIRSNGIFLLVVLLTTQLAFALNKSDTAYSRFILVQRYVAPALFAFLLITGTFEYMLPTGGESHYGFFKNLSFKQIFINLGYNIKMIGTFFYAPGNQLVLLSTAPLFFIGVYFEWKRQWGILLYIALVLGLYSLWPFQQGIRYMYPVIPFYLLFVFWGLESIYRLSSKSALTTLVGGTYGFLGFILVAYFLVSSIQYVHLHRNYGMLNSDGPFGASSMQLYEYINENTSPNDVVVFRKPRAILLMTQRVGIMLNSAQGMEKAQYVVLDLHNESVSLRESYDRGDWGGALVFSNKGFKVYKVVHKNIN